MTEVLIDVAGQEIRPGDPVVYPQMSGRSVQMVLGTLVSYNGKSAKIERQEGTRWSAGYQRTRYRDKRTGKGIDPYASDKGWEVKAHYLYTHKETGEVISEEELNRRHPIVANWSAYGYRGQNDASWAARHQYERQYVQGVLKDYVEEYRSAPTPVTIHNVKNIVKVPAPSKESK
ncbi:hypothetical protein [Plantactinospora sp. WMMB782]|uniref:hypothetical protein n=1 Tax=Plantactinospora sp. WMMB782 TaxID=3404121 RepID=UPI003B92285E